MQLTHLISACHFMDELDFVSKYFLYGMMIHKTVYCTLVKAIPADPCCCYTHLYACIIITIENTTSSIKANFLKEIEMMKKVSGTGNELSKFVVNMVGCCTVQEPLLLVLEYIKHGDLLIYLRSMRQKGNVNHLCQFAYSHNKENYLQDASFFLVTTQ